MTDSVPEISNRADAEAFLDDRIGQGVQPGLDRITGLMEFAGSPELTYPSILIAGTNGKTTVARMVQQILGAHGLSTGGFTSPHLGSVEERFTLHGTPVSSDEFTNAVRDIAWFVSAYEDRSGTPVTYFEVTAALALSIFAAESVDVAVVEVGLGGRLDATNILDASVSVLTGVDIDHTEFLGPTIDGIAAEKAAILKADGTLVTGRLPDEAVTPVSTRVDETNSTWVRFDRDFAVTDAVVAVGGWQCSFEGVFAEYNELYLPLHGHHQVENLATAIATSEMFLGRALDPELLMVAVASMRSPGRLEVVDRRPVVVLDGCHNRQGFRGLADTLDAEFPPLQWKLVLALRGERSIADLLQPMKGRVDQVFATSVADPAAWAPDVIAEAASAALGVPAEAFEDPGDALESARQAAGPEGGVAVAGSLYLAGDVRSRFEVSDGALETAHLHFEAPRPLDDDEDDVDQHDEFDPEEEGTDLG
jgi:dihydrofolate synthase/folylpolyglutamate synthase